MTLTLRFGQLGDTNDIHKAVLTLEDAVRLTPDGDVNKPSRLTSLGNSLKTCFRLLGDTADCTKAFLMHQEAVNLTQDAEASSSLDSCGHPQIPSQLTCLGDTLRASRLTSLGSALQFRFDLLGGLDDLTGSISKLEEAITLNPCHHPDKPVTLSNLGHALQLRFDRFDSLGDLNLSISTLKEAALLIEDSHQLKPGILTNLSNYLHRCFIRGGNPNDIDESISRLNEAVSLTSDDHPGEPGHLSNLVNGLRSCFEKIGDINDHHDCIAKQKEAIHTTPDGDPARCEFLHNLGNLLGLRYTELKNSDDFEEMIHQWPSSAKLAIGSAHVRFLSAKLWADNDQAFQHPSLLDAYNVALDLLPELAWLGISIDDCHYQTMQTSSVVRNAAFAAISSGQLEKAVEWLEQGRSIIWGQLLDLRTPVNALEQSYPNLAQELIVLTTQLERASRQRIDGRLCDSATPQSTAQQVHENAHRRDLLLKKIRGLEGFQCFLLPKTIFELSLAAQKGHVVILNICQTSCDALVLCHREGITHVPLPEFTPKHVETMTQSLEALIPYMERSARLQGCRKGDVIYLEEKFAHILSELWVRVVQPVLRALTIKVMFSCLNKEYHNFNHVFESDPSQEHHPHIW
ncbi:hypothetical protein K438DRAFT_1767777 [Mycena galopus ATCC 62051]|nr:hypothetical protein K438DRAFT_1767777 [Mycena galopus ATCC 62051]